MRLEALDLRLAIVKDGSEEFVVLEHAGTEGVHWDLMLEDAGALLTWRLEVPPEEIGSEPMRAEQINNHPLRFLEYEGPVQKNTGAVRRIDGGACRWARKEEGVFTVVLEGHVLKGQFQLKHYSDTMWVFCHSS